MKRHIKVAFILFSLMVLLAACQRGYHYNNVSESMASLEDDTESQTDMTVRQGSEQEQESVPVKEVGDATREISARAEELTPLSHTNEASAFGAETEIRRPQERRTVEFAYQAYGQDPLASYGVFARGLIKENFLKTQLEMIGDLDRMNEVLEDMAKYVPAAPDRYGSSVYQSLSCPDDGIRVISQADYLQLRREQYDGFFFEDRVLLLAMVFTPCTGYTGGIAEIARNGSDLEIILTETSETSFMDEAIDRYYYCLEIPKEMLEGCERLIVRNEVFYMDSGRGGGSRTDNYSLKELMENQP